MGLATKILNLAAVGAISLSSIVLAEDKGAETDNIGKYFKEEIIFVVENYSPAMTNTSRDAPQSLGIGDMDLDEDKDIVAVTPKGTFYLENIGTSKKAVYKNKGLIGDCYRATRDTRITLADLDDDGDLDVILFSSSKIYLLTNNLPR
ncbi:MAG: hypothetical protein V1914_01330 [archaeon]